MTKKNTLKSAVFPFTQVCRVMSFLLNFSLCRTESRTFPNEQFTVPIVFLCWKCNAKANIIMKIHLFLITFQQNLVKSMRNFYVIFPMVSFSEATRIRKCKFLVVLRYFRISNDSLFPLASNPFRRRCQTFRGMEALRMHIPTKCAQKIHADRWDFLVGGF